MEMMRINFKPMSDGGDDVTTALRKTDVNMVEISSAIDGSGGIVGRLDAVTQRAEAINSRVDAVDARVTQVNAAVGSKLPVAGPVFTGGMMKVGTYGVDSFRVFNSGVDIGIGGAFTESLRGRTPALQVDAQSNTSAYMPLRVTNWGIRHLFQMDVYEGGSSSSEPSLSFHFDAGLHRHIFHASGSATFAGALSQNSDHRIKDDVVRIDPDAAAAGLRGARPIEYRDNRLPMQGARRPGFIAHELDECFPLLVTGEKDAWEWRTAYKGDTTPYLPGHEPAGYEPPEAYQEKLPVLQNVDYIGTVPYLTAGWQHHDNRLASLERALDEARALNMELMDRISRIEHAAGSAG